MDPTILNQMLNLLLNDRTCVAWLNKVARREVDAADLVDAAMAMGLSMKMDVHEKRQRGPGMVGLIAGMGDTARDDIIDDMLKEKTVTETKKPKKIKYNTKLTKRNLVDLCNAIVEGEAKALKKVEALAMMANLDAEAITSLSEQLSAANAIIKQVTSERDTANDALGDAARHRDDYRASCKRLQNSRRAEAARADTATVRHQALEDLAVRLVQGDKVQAIPGGATQGKNVGRWVKDGDGILQPSEEG